ncbi:M24 family metallopeptidase [Aestuariibaculum sediminum]|uniref:Aminopeptidase P family protein n=1 Tax=Aestuariibaculum sediminum TaxID=2770637 RepID=A0A8J6Q2R6_9FLAO|nr:Xaa-Pro peptidase family protein [Aestuariibaculum sediminum]MBD0832556.1 aminopeptidase P family protein [Aestuariibaculum sediminum]
MKSKYGIGGSSAEKELEAIKPMAHLIQPILEEEYNERIKKACLLMQAENASALYLNAGSSLVYFTGTHWHPSERMVGAILLKNGDLHYIAPNFERGTINDFMVIEGEIHCWEEHESPFALFKSILQSNGVKKGTVLIDEGTPFFIFEGINQVSESYHLKNAKPVISACRMVKSESEISIIQALMNITLEVQKAAARILKVGITAKEVTDFIHEAHKRYGVPSGSYFCIVLFGRDTSFPHGVKNPKPLDENDIVLVDTGCSLHDYISDITRTYVFGEATEYQRKIWNIEKAAQQVAFKTSQAGNTCSFIDVSVRSKIESYGLGPDYDLPGVPHRTGHGIGLDIHEYPYILKGNETLLRPGYCYSIEPMICVPDAFGIRLEDHVYITNDGPKWFTKPAYSIENPFGV